jgi:hypothetical protein
MRRFRRLLFFRLRGPIRIYFLVSDREGSIGTYSLMTRLMDNIRIIHRLDG